MTPPCSLSAAITRSAIRCCRQVPGRLLLSQLTPLTAAAAVSQRREHTSETRLMRLSPDRWLQRERETGAVTLYNLPASPAPPGKKLLLTGEPQRAFLWLPWPRWHRHVHRLVFNRTRLRVHLGTMLQICMCTGTDVCLHWSVCTQTCVCAHTFGPIIRQKSFHRCPHPHSYSYTFMNPYSHTIPKLGSLPQRL